MVFLPTGLVLTRVTLSVVIGLVHTAVCSGRVGSGCVLCIAFLSCELVCFAYANSYKTVTKLDCDTV